MTGLRSPQLGGLSPGHPSQIHNDGIAFLSFLILTPMFPKITQQALRCDCNSKWLIYSRSPHSLTVIGGHTLVGKQENICV